MGWFAVPWSAVIGLLVVLGLGGVLCFFFATPFFPMYLVAAVVIGVILFGFIVFVQFLPIILPLLVIGVLLYMYAVRQGWIPASFAYSAIRSAGGYVRER